MSDADFDEMLDRVTRFIGKKYRRHSEVDDLVQEGCIALWRAWESGERDPQQLIWKAMNRAGHLLQEGKPFGKPKADRYINRSQGAATREKLRAFIDEYVRLHGKKPTYKEMGEACGISHQGIAVHLKRMYLFDGGPTEKVVVESFDRLPDSEDLSYLSVDPGFADETDTRLAVKELVSRLPERERLAIYYKYWEDRTHQGIADGLGGYTAQVGANWVKKGLDRLRTQIGAGLD